MQRDESDGEREVEEVRIRRGGNRVAEAEKRSESSEMLSDESDEVLNEYRTLQCERMQGCRGSSHRVK